MPRLGLLRRRKHDVTPESVETPAVAEEYEQPFEPFVPVEPAEPDDYSREPVESDELAEPLPGRRGWLRRRPLPPTEQPQSWRPRLGFELRPDALLAAALLGVGGIVATLVLQDRVDITLDERWPVVILALAGLWMLVALLRREATSFLGGAALAGVSVSLLLDMEEIAVFEETVLGVVLVTVGLGIVIRGLLLRQTTA